MNKQATSKSPMLAKSSFSHHTEIQFMPAAETIHLQSKTSQLATQHLKKHRYEPPHLKTQEV
jgi:hypothetical protein